MERPANAARATDEHTLADRLDGWKAIASYLNRDVRTAQRWERSEGLPVYRHEHQKQSSAHAFRSELDEWLRLRTVPGHPAEPILNGPPPARRTSWRNWGLVAAIGLSAVSVVIAFVRVGGPATQPPHGRDTKDPQAYAAFADGQALYNARRYPDAVAALEHAVAIDPAYGSGWALLAKAYGRMAQWVWAGGSTALARATAVASRASAVAPNSSDTHVALALAARAREDVPRWRDEAQRAIALDSRDAEAYALLADWYSASFYACGQRATDPDLADTYYLKALELKPDLVTAVENRASNLRHLGRYDECVAIINESLERLSDEAPLRLVRGRCLLAKGDLAAAARDIEPLRNNPKVAPVGVLVGLGWLELARGNLLEGTRDLESAASTNTSVQAELTVAETYSRAGATERAMVHLERAIEMNRSCVDTIATSVQFRSLRQTQEVKGLLAEHGIR